MNRTITLAAALAVVAALAPPSHAAGADRFDAALQEALAEIQARPDLTDAEEAAARLDAMKSVMSAADAMGKGLEDLQAWTETVRHTGLCFDHDFEGLDKVAGWIDNVRDKQWFQSFREATRVGGQLHKAAGRASAARVALAKARKVLTEQRDLPTGARKSLAALVVLGEALKQAGDVPGLGKCLEAYGQVTDKLIGVVDKTREKIVYGINDGHVMGKDLPELAGLPKNVSTVGYQRTDLWRRGLPVVRGVQDHGAHEFFLRGDGGLWVKLSKADYEKARAVAAHWMVTHKGKPPKPNEVLRLLNDDDARSALARDADDEVRWILHKKRIRRVMVDPDKPLREAVREFDAVERTVRGWADELGVPMDRPAVDAAVRLHLLDPQWAQRWFRAKVYRLYPEVRQAMERKGFDPDTADIDALKAAMGQYRRYVADVAAGRRKAIDFSAPAGPVADTRRPAAPPTPQPGPKLPPGRSERDAELTRTAPPPSAEGKRPDRSAILAWRDRQVAALRRRMADDPLRAANKRAALAGVGKAKKLTCAKCGFSGKHWWIENSWSCPRCEFCTTVQDRKRPDGLTYRQYAAARMKVYEDKIAAVRAEAQRLLTGKR